jgi:hypothetical protein
MPTVHDEIRVQSEAFAASIAALVRTAALEAVQAVLAVSSAPAQKAASTKKAVPAKKAAPRKKAAPATAAPTKTSARAVKRPTKTAPPTKTMAKTSASRRALGGKRPPAALAALVEKLGAYIQANPGLGAAAVGKALATPTAQLALPIKKLLGAKRIRSEGQRSATTYFPA